MTQPVLCNEYNKFESLFWMGYSQKGILGINKKYYSTTALVKGIKKYNDEIRKFCYNKDILLVDLDSILDKDTTIFCDDCHFNENGSKIVANILFNTLQKINK